MNLSGLISVAAPAWAPVSHGLGLAPLNGFVVEESRWSARRSPVGLYNFQKRFVPLILDGRKTHTIRAQRKNPDKAGNILHLYTGLRTKKAQLLMRVRCARIEEITIDACGHECNCDGSIEIEGIELSESEREALARRDGFENFDEMLEFWSGRLPFEGHIIHWKKV